MKDNKKNSPFREVIEAEERIESASKSLYHRIINWVKAHPLLTLLFSFFVFGGFKFGEFLAVVSF